MAVDEFTLVLSGHLCEPQMADMRPFWNGFIELQRKLPKDKPLRQIIAHSWNPELAHLVRKVYAPLIECHEHEGCFYPEVISQIEPRERFKRKSDRQQYTWKSASVQSVLANARSRSRAAELMDGLPLKGGQVLVTYWDLGQTGSTQLSKFIFDESLPNGYLYLPYLPDVDEGYADAWVLAPWPEARKFGRFEAFVLDALAGRNGYLNLFSRDGWPRARVKSYFEVWRAKPFVQYFQKLVLSFSQAILHRATGNTLSHRILRRFAAPVQYFFERPPITAENSFVPGLGKKSTVFPRSRAINIRAILKYFIYSEGLRDRVRFLTREDFDVSAQSGQLINPTPLVLLFHEVDDSIVAQLIALSPMPLSAVYQMGGGKVRQYIPDGRGGSCVSTIYPEGGTPRDLMAAALDIELVRSGELSPLLTVPTVDRFLACRDWFYLNALTKYLSCSDVGYIGFARTGVGAPCPDFPGLELVSFGAALSLRLGAGNAKAFRALLDVLDPELQEITESADRIMLEFPAVAHRESLF